MNKTRKTLVMAFVLALQCLAIGWLIVRYERVVRLGAEVRFACKAYDPYDPLRGRYLSMSVSETTTNFPVSVTNDLDRSRNKFVVRLEPSTNGLWRIAEAAFAPTGEGVWVKPRSSCAQHRLGWSEQGKDEEWSDFKKRRERSGVVVSATFPNQLFVNEKLAPAAEGLLRKKTDAAVAVYRVFKGEMVLTGIEIEGRPILEQVARE